MTEAEWLACENPEKPLMFLQGKATDRQLRLFAVACCRRIWHLMTDERSQKAVEEAERFADGTINLDSWLRLQLVHAEANGPYEEASERFGRNSAHTDTAASAVQVSTITDDPTNDHDCASKSAYTYVPCGEAVSGLPGGEYDTALWNGELLNQTFLLRDIIGNPFRPITLDPAWLTSNVVSLAQAIYNDRAFDRMPILADAIEEAGCTNPDILQHCRQPGVHVRGCWVVDLLLDKE